MSTNKKAYEKTLEDELDWKLIDELHTAVSQISSFCFETKKFCVTTEFVVLTLLVKFTKDRLDLALFVAALSVPLCFWFLDAVAYYYQVKIRGNMELARTRIKGRHQEQLLTTTGSVIAQDRINKSTLQSVISAVFNHSMWIYGLLIGVDLIVWFLYEKGLFG